MSSFDDLVAPLLDDPPRPAPAVEALQQRVAQRRRRRTTSLAALSVAAVLLIGTAVALPRDRGADLLTGPPGTAPGPTGSTVPAPASTVADLPELTPAVVNLVIEPQRASADDLRRFTVHNNGDEPYRTCLNLELRRWDGATWRPFGWIYLQEGLGSFEVLAHPYPHPGSACTPIELQTDLAAPFFFHEAGEDATADAMAANGVEMLTLSPGWYELSEGPARGHFEITAPSPAEVAAPAIEPSVVALTLDPERAPADRTRTLAIRNDGATPYATCYQYDLQRWDGTRWQPTGSLGIDPLDGSITLLPRGAEDVMDCTPRTTTEGSTSTISFRTAALQQFGLDRTTPYHTPATLDPGWYELSDSMARGRFEITAPGSPDPGASVAPSTPVVDRVTIDLHPGRVLTGVHETQPDRGIAVDDDTIALSWTGSCNTPAAHLVVEASTDAIALRLSTGTFELEGCPPDLDRWIVTVDLPFPIAGRRLSTRVDNHSFALGIEPKPAGTRLEPFEVSVSGSPFESDAVSSMLLNTDPTPDTPGLQSVSGSACARTDGGPDGMRFSFSFVDALVVPQLHVPDVPATSTCVRVGQATLPPHPLFTTR